MSDPHNRPPGRSGTSTGRIVLIAVGVILAIIILWWLFAAGTTDNGDVALEEPAALEEDVVEEPVGN